jgi:hypothetical protein
MKPSGLLTALGIACAAFAVQAQNNVVQAQNKVDIVSVTGCLREQGTGTWMLVAATEPVSSAANAPPRTELPTAPPEGKTQVRLIGVDEFNLPMHKDHTVLVKGLLIKAMPVNRINITSVTEVAQTCHPSAPK